MDREELKKKFTVEWFSLWEARRLETIATTNDSFEGYIEVKVNVDTCHVIK